jgi:hypothetical protein
VAKALRRMGASSGTEPEAPRRLVDQMNSGPAFNWIQVIRDPQGKPRATLRILGNPTQSYRDEDGAERGGS